MPILKVDTFQHDIVDEIKRKDDVYSKIPTTPTPESTPEKLKRPLLPIITVILFIVTLLSIVGFSIYYFHNLYRSSTEQLPTVTTKDVPKKTASLSSLSETLENDIGQYVENVEKKQGGYIITLTPNSPVFSYMIKNEDKYIVELANTIAGALPEVKDVTIVTTPASTTPSTSTTSMSTSSPSTKKTKVVTSTSTQKTKTATSTGKGESSDDDTVRIPLISATTTTFWKDITISNQNMRMWNKDGRTLIYAFVNLQKLIISTSPEEGLTIRDAILKQ